MKNYNVNTEQQWSGSLLNKRSKIDYITLFLCSFRDQLHITLYNTLKTPNLRFKVCYYYFNGFRTDFIRNTVKDKNLCTIHRTIVVKLP